MKKTELLNDLFSFENKVIIITGGAGAIGSALAELLGNLGANVVITDINQERVNKVASEIQKATGKETLGLVADSTDENQMKELVDKVVAKFGKISGLVNNVGWGAATPIWGSDTEKMVNSYKLNTLSAYNLTKFCMPYLEKEENASVIFSNSRVGNTPSPEFIEYSTAKAALLNMAKSMAVISGPKVRFNTVIIGSVDNGESTLDAGFTMEMLQKINDSIVMKRRGFPADIAHGIMFLMSKAASWVTGVDLTLDGGGRYESKMPKKED
ncbi:SDR family NAD(P)-dependent oxidoreductase [Algoriphagus formosus]|nr:MULTISPECIES: SDR family oxidoreductase [Algoriphagus]